IYAFLFKRRHFTRSLFTYTTLFRSIEDVGPRLDHRAHGVEVALEIRCQHLDRGGGAAAPDGANCPGKDSRTAVLQVVAVDRRDRSEEHTSELQSPDHLVFRLLLDN